MSGCPDCPTQAEVELVRWAMVIALQRLTTNMKTAHGGSIPEQTEQVLTMLQEAVSEGNQGAVEVIRQLCHEAKHRMNTGAIPLEELAPLLSEEPS